MSPSRKPSDTATLAKLVVLAERETGMKLSDSRFSRFEEAVDRALERYPGVDLISLLDEDGKQATFLDQLATELTVGESFFFRNENHFRALREHVIPTILQSNAKRRELHVWSAGCSTGEEPHSLAILLDQMLNQSEFALADEKNTYSPGWDVSILGTDINPRFLHLARIARYRKWSFRRTDIQNDERYFTRHEDDFELNAMIRDRVRFAYLNLVKDSYPSPLTGTVGLDLIVFRNVAIYLRAEIITEIVERFRKSLRPGGWLLVGEAEIAQMPRGGFDVCRFEEATFFRKRAKENVGNVATLSPREPVRIKRSLQENVADRKLPKSENVSWDERKPNERVRGTLDGSPQAGANSQSQPSGSNTQSQPSGSQANLRSIEKCLQQNDFARARQLLFDLRDQLSRSEALLLVVRTLLQQSQSSLAREIVDACIENDPLLIEAYLLKAALAEESGDLAGAEEACRKALYSDRNCIMAHFHLAMVQQRSGKLEAAIKGLRTILELTRNKQPNETVPLSDGICVARLREMTLAMLEM